ncbi:EF-Tu/IF-2/RF-3 family GTPase [Algirhabdus cladophorae]|uniref:EF-Tu/IF-2/RF-3 family GTPase n=1 Tax=Algirhabdus cladophorae TaxID=3377108 RepID=UPI003B8455D6
MSFHLKVEDVFTISGRGTVVTGTVEGGPVSVGDRVLVRKRDGEVIETIVTGIEAFRRLSERAEIGQQVGLVLRGVDRDGLQGAIVLAPGARPDAEPSKLALEALSFSGPRTSGRPALMLPLRLETSFDGDTLLIRAFPDQIHVDAHDPALSESEHTLGVAWLDARAAGRPRTEIDANLIHTVGAPRARHIIALALQGQLDTAKALPPKQAQATLLPKRLIAEAKVGGHTFIAEGLPIPDTVPVAPAPTETNALSGSLRWITQFSEAEDIGLGLRLKLDSAAVAAGIDRLTVFGLSDGGDRSDAFLAHLEMHARSSGTGTLTPFEPTKGNNRSAPGWGLDAAPTQKITEALGLRDLPLTQTGATPSAEGTQADLGSVLWHALVRPALTQIWNMRDSADLSEARDFFLRHMRPLGAFPALRVGQQPYHIAPLSPPPSQGARRGIWHVAGAAADVTPSLAAMARDMHEKSKAQKPAERMLDTLTRQPTGQTWRIRPMLGLNTVASLLAGAKDQTNTPQLAQDTLAELGSVEQLLRNLGLDGRALSDSLTLPGSDAGRVCKALVRDTLDPRDLDDGAVDDPMIEAILRGHGWRDRLDQMGAPSAAWDPRAGVRRPEDMPEAEPLFRLLAENAIVRLVSDFMLADRRGNSALLRALKQAVESETTLAQDAWQVRTRAAAALEDEIGDSAPQSQSGDPAAKEFAFEISQLRDALLRLNNTSARAVHHALAAALDTLAVRVDAVISAAASQDLTRARQGGTDGLDIGAWGVLENIRPRETAPEATFIPAPSERIARLLALLERARAGLAASGLEGVLKASLTGAELREGRTLALALRDGEAPDHAISRVVARSLTRAGHGPLVEKLVAQFPAKGASPLAIDVFDGLAFLDWTPRRSSRFDSADLPPLRAQQDRLGTMIDAMGDLMLAEAASALSDRNVDAAQGALATLSAGGLPHLADPAAVTPASKGTGLDFSLAMLAPNAALRGARDDAARLYPRLARLAHSALPHLAGRITTGPTASTFDALGLSALGLTLLSRPGGDGAARLRKMLSARLKIEPSLITFDADAEATLWAASRLAEAIFAARGLTPEDFPPEANVTPLPAILTQDIATARAALEDLLTLQPAPAVVPGGRILDIEPGVLDPVIPDIDLGPAFDPIFDPGSVVFTPVSQLTAAQIAARYFALDLIAAPDPSLLEAGRSAIQARLAAADAASDQVSVLKALIDGMPALTPLMAATTDAFAASTEIKNAGQSDLSLWLDEVQCVRGRAGPMADCLLGSDVPLHALQWPVNTTDPADWIGGPRNETETYFGRTSLVATGADPNLRPGEVFAGLQIDSWTEVVPDATLTAAVAARADAPPARAPQLAVLAVPSATTPHHTPSSIAQTLHLAMDLAQARSMALSYLPFSWAQDPTLEHLRSLVPFGAALASETLLTRATCPPQPEG